MKGLKCNFQDIEYFKKILFQNGLVDTHFLPKRLDDGFVFPLILSDSLNFNKKFSVIDCDFEEKEKQRSMQEILLDNFYFEEVSEIKTAFDVVGTIAIIEVDDKFKDRAVHIAEAVIQTNKNVKTVLMKSGIHSGEFRTQNMEYVLGEKTKESIYLENGVKIKLNVEDVYFSPRLSSDRKRIAGLVKPEEEVMELFSGCAPYSLAISKLSGAKNINGIELNPKGHLYGIENIELNKISNMNLFCGDVKKLVPKINNLGIGLKVGLNNYVSICEKNSDVQLFEIQLTSEQLEFEFNRVEEACSFFEERGKLVYFHHIPFFKNGIIGVGTDPDCFSETEEEIQLLLKLCSRRNIKGFGLHIFDGFTKENNLKDETKEFLSDVEVEKLIENVIVNLNYLFSKYKKEKIKDYLFIENSIRTIRNLESFEIIKKKTGLKNVILDLVHLFISNIHSKYFCHSKKIDLEYFYHLVEQFKKKFNVYFHIGDTTGNHPDDRDAIEIGKGIIDFSKIVDLVDFGVIEVWDYFSEEYIENQRSYNNFCKLRDKILGPKKYDRILMPLPKTAEDFLDDALKLAKKGTIIHFYDFLNEKLGEIPGVAVEKIKKACDRNKLKFKILDHVKCGDHAPHTFRVCVDFEVL